MSQRSRPGGASRAFTLMEIMIVVAIIAITVLVALPGFFSARERSRQTACQDNLIRIDGALQQFILQENLVGTEDLAPFWPSRIVGSDLYLRHLPVCPSSGTYLIGFADAFEPVQCNYINPAYPHVVPQVLQGGT